MSQHPVIPAPTAITSREQIATMGASLSAWAQEANDASEVRDAAARWSAITAYVRRTSKEGIAEAEAVLRRLEVRVGQLLGPAVVGTNQHSEGTLASVPSEISRQERIRLRDLAQHADIVETVIAESTDANPPSQIKVLKAISASKQRNEVAEDQKWAAELREAAPQYDAQLDIKRQKISLALRTMLNSIESFTHSPADVAWMLSSAIDHVRIDLIRRLESASEALTAITKEHQ